jgi:hypothetical protein
MPPDISLVPVDHDPFNEKMAAISLRPVEHDPFDQQAMMPETVFNDKIVDILRKYGIAGLSMLPPAIAQHFGRQVVPVDHDPFAQGL